jgi:hypothetical protein
MRHARAVRIFNEAIRAGASLHVFRSGGGLRVARLEQGPGRGELLGYGEHLHAEGAIHHAAVDYRAKGREYGAVYGLKIPNYWTGSAEANDAFDEVILRGDKVDARAEGGQIVVEIRGHGRLKSPAGYREREVVRVGRGEDFHAALVAALAADPVEVNE